MTDTPHNDDVNPQSEVNPQIDARRRQDLECLTLLTQAHALYREYDDIDRMLATLKGTADELPILP